MLNNVSTPVKDEVAEIDFRKLIDQCLESLRFFPGSENMMVETTVSKNKNFYSNAQLIAIVINSLLMNCFRFKKENTQSQAKINVAYDSYKVILTITDNGVGINENEIGKIFNLFHRNNKEDLGGGIGLYMVNEIIKKLGGKISVESAEGRGTEFTLEIPNQIHLQNVLIPAKQTIPLKYFY